MPKHKHKQLLQTKKQTKSKQPEVKALPLVFPEPESANEFLQAGVDFEEAGEKWRAGDAAKSLRFFTRALDTYETGLRKYPDDFDLAYNRARLQYEIAQQPRLLVHFPTPVNELLRTALESHRYAIGISQENADLFFNTGQVLTSLAENAIEDQEARGDEADQALKLLQEALESFQRCLSIQEYQYGQSQDKATEMAEDNHTGPESGEHEDTKMDLSADDASHEVEDEEWATIVEPVTVDSLLDTTLAQVETLTTVCSLESMQQDWPLAWVDEYFRTSLREKLLSFASTASRPNEAVLAIAKFRSAFSATAFRCDRIDVQTYAHDIQEGFQNLDLSQEPQGLCDRADAELALVTNVRQKVRHDPAYENLLEDAESYAKFIWTHTTTALTVLTTASKLPPATGKNLSINLPRIHLRRGDCELLRLSLSEPPTDYALASKSRATLLGNAALYYRMAGRQAQAPAQSGTSGSESEGGSASANANAKEEGEEAYIKGVIAGLLEEEERDATDAAPAEIEGREGGGGGGGGGGQGLSEMTRRDLREMAQEMGEEGVLGEQGMERVLALL